MVESGVPKPKCHTLVILGSKYAKKSVLHAAAQMLTAAILDYLIYFLICAGLA